MATEESWGLGDPPDFSFMVDKSDWTQAQHRFWYYLNRIQDVFHPVRLWPPWAQEDIVRKHKNNNQRFKLMLFLLLNGLYPPLAKEWVKTWDVREGKYLQKEKYDDNAERDMDGVLEKFATGKLFGHGYLVYDIHLQAPVKS